MLSKPRIRKGAAYVSVILNVMFIILTLHYKRNVWVDRGGVPE